jgi:hypothetical protein
VSSDMPTDYFGDEVAARYDETLGRWCEAEVVGATVVFLA